MSTNGFGHGWVGVSDGTNSTIRGFYPSEDPGLGAAVGATYDGVIRDDSSRPLGYVDMSFSITEEGFNNAMNTINAWQQNTPNWSLNNNCINFLLDVLTASGADTSNLNMDDWRTNGWLDPRKIFDCLRQNGGTIRE